MKSWPLFLLLAAILGGAAWFVLGSGPTQSGDSSSTHSNLDGENASDAGLGESNTPGTLDTTSSAVDRRELENRPTDASMTPGEMPVLAFEGPAAMVKMNLVDGKGAPINDATASFNLNEWTNSLDDIDMEAWNEAKVLPVDSQGQLLANVPTGKTFSIKVGGAFWRSQSRTVQPLQGQEVVDLGEIALTPANRVAGIVRNKDGEFIIKAQVSISETNGSMWGNGFNDATATNEEGQFSFDGIRSGRFKFSVSAQGYVTTILQAENIKQRQGEFPLEITLERGAMTKGRVTDEDGVAVAGAEVYTIQTDPRNGWWGDWNPPLPTDTEPAAISDENGDFVVYGLSDDESTKLGAKAEGYGTGYTSDVEADGNAIIKLPRHFVLSGEVVAAGEKVEFASVHLQRFRDDGEMDWGGQAVSDKDGKFKFEPVAPGSYTLSLTSSLGKIEEETIEIKADRDDLVLELPLDNLLTIQVTDADGNPVSGAKVGLSAENSGQNNNLRQMGYSGEIFLNDISFSNFGGMSYGSIYSTKTDINGIAKFGSVEPSKYQLGVSATGFATSSDPLEVTGATQDHSVELGTGGNLRVLVTDDSGQPVIGIQVALRTPDSQNDMKTLATDDAGRAIWNDLKAGDYQISYKASAAEGWWWDRDDDPKAPVDRSTVKVKVGETTDFAMQVRDLALVTVHVTRQGVNAEDVKVSLTEVKDENQNNYFYGGWEGNGTATDGRGEVELQPVTAGEYEIVVKAGKSSPATKVKVNLHVGPQRIEVQLEGTSVEGKLTGNSGPVSTATVALVKVEPDTGDDSRSRNRGMVSFSFNGSYQMTSGDEQSTNTRTDKYGNYGFSDVPEGQWQIVARAEGHATWKSEPFTVRSGSSVELGSHHMYPGAVIHGRDANYVPSAENANNPWGRGPQISLMDEQNTAVSMTNVDENGDYSFGDLPSGTYTIKRRRFKSEPIVASEGGDYRVDIPLEEQKDNQ
jgi:protocatechuate 3,4-dioxygenase beta subunit/5-hydroxyisourate hydrolase-like protein (transthyretin family)